MQTKNHSWVLRIVLTLGLLASSWPLEPAARAAARSISKSDTAKKGQRSKKRKAKGHKRKNTPHPASSENKSSKGEGAPEAAASSREAERDADQKSADDAAHAIPQNQFGQTFQFSQVPANSEVNGAESRDASNGALYSCPSHPSITSSQPSNCSICGMQLVAAPGTPPESTAPAFSNEAGTPPESMAPAFSNEAGTPPESTAPTFSNEVGTPPESTASFSFDQGSPEFVGEVEARVGHAKRGFRTYLSLDNQAATPLSGLDVSKLEFLYLLGGSINLEYLGEKGRISAGAYARLPPSFSAPETGHHAAISSLLGPFTITQHFYSPSYDQVILDPTATLRFGWLPVIVDLSYTLEGDPAAAITAAWNLSESFMMQVAAGSVMALSEQSAQVNRTFAVNSMLGIMYARGSTTAELTAQYGHGFYNSESPVGSGGAGVIDINAMQMPIVDLGMVMLEGRHVFSDLVGIGGGMMLMSNTAVGADGLRWMSQAHLALDVAIWLIDLQLAFTASSIGDTLTLPDTYQVSLGISFVLDFPLGSGHH